jgi:hypothetical protein
MHALVHKLYFQLKFSHMPISHIDFSDVVDNIFWSDLGGTIEERKDRINRLFHLIREMPKPPQVPRNAP